MSIYLEPSARQNQKSFYGKATVVQDGDKAVLVSYSTRVAAYNKKTGKLTIKGWYSATTAKHINAFAQQYAGTGKLTKSDMDNWDND